MKVFLEIMNNTKIFNGTAYVGQRYFPQEVGNTHLLVVRREGISVLHCMQLIFYHLLMEGCELNYKNGKLILGKEDGFYSHVF